LTHMILEAVKPVSAGLAVISISRSLPTRRVMSSHSSPVRWSAQMMEGRSTWPFSSSITRPCICPEMPRAAICRGSTPDWRTTWEMVAMAASHQSCGVPEVPRSMPNKYFIMNPHSSIFTRQKVYVNN